MQPEAHASLQSIHLPKWVDWLWLALCAVYVLAGVAMAPYHGDEASLIFMGRDFYYHVQGQLDKIYVQEFEKLEPDAALEQQLRLINGTLPKYMYGAIAYAMGADPDTLSESWAWGAGWDWNIENGAIEPGDDVLLAGRYASAILLALSIVIMFQIGQKVGGRGVAYLTTAYLVLNPAVLLNGRRAMMEGVLLFFSLLIVLVGLHLLVNRRWYMFLLLGVISGLTVAAKHPGILPVALVFISLAYVSLWRAYQEHNWLFAVRQIAKLFGAGVLSLILFFALNPSWWQNPQLAAELVIQERSTTLSAQVTSAGGPADMSERVGQFYRQALIAQPMYSEVDYFKPYIVDEVAAYEASPWRGIAIGGSDIGAIILIILMLIGLGKLLFPLTDISRMMIVWTSGTLAFTIAATPLEWQRYYLAAFPVIGLLSALGLITLYNLVTRQRRTAT
ncbi:phospholipid carrier-dependent glycosyltransferase [Phototrophicus methaneseepsis]|uniref:Phospholipid carrier-dependent glycosyltransferase n=1 Tax=Phototrophicus methaneseepsis TaxID=2710758 RepID=A0A7S8E7L5_9CHLR|nr:phospholipid carrier-dependent glycosyltransferase [Phototrophicus methaneseepsis]QPC81847.1 phospholipid carrier-dependent glycosyltransferase [Phototrophicus methaneseepsis]